MGSGWPLYGKRKTMTAPRSRCRQPRQLDAGIFQAEISSFRLHLAAEGSSGPANLATIRAAIIAAIKDAGYLHVPEGRRDHTTPAEALCLHGLD